MQFVVDVLVSKPMCSQIQGTHFAWDMCLQGKKKTYHLRYLFLYRETHTTKNMCSPVGKHKSLCDVCSRVGDTSLSVFVFQVEIQITQGMCDMCFPGTRTHITKDMCFQGRRTHITRDMCFLGGGTHFTSDVFPA